MCAVYETPSFQTFLNVNRAEKNHIMNYNEKRFTLEYVSSTFKQSCVFPMKSCVNKNTYIPQN